LVVDDEVAMLAPVAAAADDLEVADVGGARAAHAEPVAVVDDELVAPTSRRRRWCRMIRLRRST
jgi:hypothetical protein